MTAIYSITLDDYLKANRTFALHTTRKRRISAFLLRWILVPLGLLLVLEGAILAYIKEYSLAWMLAVFGVIFALWPWGHRRTLRRLYTQQQLDREFEFSVEDRGIRWQRVDKSVNATYDWTA
ncbi:MAG: hypothetical protein JO150_01815, partial [Acidobacteriaceae bacterium]|nr:hypothetical protein [Acidobacteriaceae bacterium]